MYRIYRIEVIHDGAVIVKFDVCRAAEAVQHFYSYMDEVDARFIDEVKLYSTEGRGLDGHPSPLVLRNSYTADHGLERHETPRGLVRLFTSHHKKKELTNGSDSGNAEDAC